MALRRQGLSQRRKAVGFTQESLAEHLGVERSTIVRWEAGGTEPLPSIRPSLARALQVSLDQLTELLTKSENPAPTQASAARSPAPLFTPLVSDDLGHPVADADPQAAIVLGATPSGLPIPHLADTGSEVREWGQTEISHRPSPTVITLAVEPADVQPRRARSRRFTRLAAAGVVALAGGAASVLFMSSPSVVASHSRPIPPAAAGTPAPDLGNNLRSEVIRTTPGAAPSQPADSPAPSGAAAVPAPHTAKATSHNRVASPSRSRASTRNPPPPRTPAIPAEAYAWSRASGLSADQHGPRLHRELSQWP